MFRKLPGSNDNKFQIIPRLQAGIERQPVYFANQQGGFWGGGAIIRPVYLGKYFRLGAEVPEIDIDLQWDGSPAPCFLSKRKM